MAKTTNENPMNGRRTITHYVNLFAKSDNGVSYNIGGIGVNADTNPVIGSLIDAFGLGEEFGDGFLTANIKSAAKASVAEDDSFGGVSKAKKSPAKRKPSLT